MAGETPQGVPPWGRKSGQKASGDMQYYSADFKQAAIAKMAVPGGRSATSLSEELGVSQSSLSRWLRERGTVTVNGENMKQRRPEDWTAEEKVAAVLDFEKLSEDQRGTFLREKGLHEATLARWKAEIVEGMKLKPFAQGKKDPQQKRIAALERELRRKEAALAEAAALLVLKKKADAIWGEEKDGKHSSRIG
jgi:transposase